MRKRRKTVQINCGRKGEKGIKVEKATKFKRVRSSASMPAEHALIIM